MSQQTQNHVLDSLLYKQDSIVQVESLSYTHTTTITVLSATVLVNLLTSDDKKAQNHCSMYISSLSCLDENSLRYKQFNSTTHVDNFLNLCYNIFAPQL